MITREKATQIAKQLKPDVTGCEEWKEHYVFYTEGDDESAGGGNAPVVIVKKTGKAITYGTFLATAPEDDEELGDYRI